jgi:hypothetical protein
VKQLHPQQRDPASLQKAFEWFKREAKTLENLGNKCDRIPTLLAYFQEKATKLFCQHYFVSKVVLSVNKHRIYSNNLADTWAISLCLSVSLWFNSLFFYHGARNRVSTLLAVMWHLVKKPGFWVGCLVGCLIGARNRVSMNPAQEGASRSAPTKPHFSRSLVF